MFAVNNKPVAIIGITNIDPIKNSMQEKIPVMMNELKLYLYSFFSFSK